MIDMTEQERLLSFIVQKYCKTKGFNTERRHVHPVRKMMLLKQHVVHNSEHRLHSPLSLHRKEKVQRDEISIGSVLNLCVSSLSHFF